MVKYNILITALLFFCDLLCTAQDRNSIWTFGDSTGIDFSSLSNPASFNTSLDTRGTCVSISDSAGFLLFYANTRASVINSGQVWNSSHQLMPNGDDIRGQGWYHEMITIPDPGNDSLYYLFSICVTSSCPFGLYYSLINIKSDSVIQKNIQLQSFPMVDCLTAVKHGNGRDWWLVFRRWYQNFQPTNEFFTYLISPDGITNFNTQTIGATHQANSGQLTFSNYGDKLIFTNLSDLIEILDFDRCSGLLNNPVIIQPANPPQSAKATWSSAFSPNDNVLYVSTSGSDTNYLYQLDLTAANIYASRIDLDTFYLPPVSPGALKLAPDGKIYFSCAYDNGFNFNYPYADTMYNYVNMNLSVINYPDSLGTACSYAPFSFYLGGKRTYYGLPNNPNYHLGPKIGSGCDTLTAINEHSQQVVISNLSPNPNNGEFTVNYLLPNGKSGELEVFNATGQKIFYQRLPRYTYMQNLSLKNPAEGIYLLKISGNGKVAVRKFVLSK